VTADDCPAATGNVVFVTAVSSQKISLASFKPHPLLKGLRQVIVPYLLSFG
jgi:hypothetical protein